MSVEAHYGRPGLEAAILAALRAAGKDPDRLTPEDLAPVDQFHTRGRDATLELARLAELTPGRAVLDVGGGIGGPARTLVRDFGCPVTVLDLTEAYCRAGEELTRRTGLTGQVRFQHGDALALPFPEASFDVGWTQHSSMNVADKRRMYGELHRVIRPGGRLALHEIMAGPAGPPHFPVPWARDPALSHLAPPEAMRELLRAIGFREHAWQDTSPAATEWFRQRLAMAQRAAGAPEPGLHLLLGEDFPAMFRNQVRNLEEGRIAVIEAVWLR
jgi:MPBQ/MSBQ methyltransferase